MEHKLLQQAAFPRGLFRARTLGVATILAVALSGWMAVAQTTYSYTGNNFTLFSCAPNPANPGVTLCTTPAPANTYTSYTATDHVTATLTLASPLGPNFAYADVSGLPGFQLTLNDGQQTLQTPGQAASAFVSTDANGQINQWQLVLPSNPQNIQIITESTPFGAIRDQGLINCCGPTVTNLAENSSAAGTWTIGSAAPDPATLTLNLINQVSNPLLVLSNGQVRIFTAELNGALQSIQAGQTRLATLQLRTFIETVRLFRRFGGMSSQTSNTLITSAQAIIAVL